MEYGKLEPTESARYIEPLPRTQTQIQTRKNILVKYARVTLLVILFLIVVASIAITIIIVVLKHHHHYYKNNTLVSSPSPNNYNYNYSLMKICDVTRYRDVCVNSLREYMNTKMMEDSNYAVEAMIGYGEDHRSLVHISLNVTLERLKKGLDYLMEELKGFDQVMDSFQWSAHDDCVEFIQDSVDLLTRTRPLLWILLSSDDDDDLKNYQLDLVTWMAAICANQDTCTEGFQEAGGAVKEVTAQILQELWQIVSNHVDISSKVVKNDVVSGRGLMDHNDPSNPRWISGKKMDLLGSTLDKFKPNVTVSQNVTEPNTTVKSIKEAIKMAPKNSSIPFIIYIKAGRYQEVDLKVDKSKTNLWFIGDGIGKTIITGNRSARADNVSTIKTATFGVSGAGFVARGVTFESTAGPENHQAVALLVKSDESVFYECEMKGYQDTLYVHSFRQFYRNCDIYGTVDFIFGKAQAAFQNCTIYARKPMEHQKNTIIAHKLVCLPVCTGISIHESHIRAARDLEPVKANYSTYLGRPWNEWATSVYMLSYIGDHVDPQGWIPWNATSSLDTVLYGEFKNYGPGANTSHRVKALGVHASMSIAEAAQFTVEQFVGGSSWIRQTKVPFEAGLY